MAASLQQPTTACQGQAVALITLSTQCHWFASLQQNTGARICKAMLLTALNAAASPGCEIMQSRQKQRHQMQKIIANLCNGLGVANRSSIALHAFITGHWPCLAWPVWRACVLVYVK